MYFKTFLVAFFVVFFFNILKAQNNNEISEDIHLSIVKGLSLKKLGGNIDFGEALSTNRKHWKIISPKNGARFVVTGIANRKITINYTRIVTLNNYAWVSSVGGERGKMKFISHVRRTGKNSTYTNSKRVRNGRRYKLQNSNGIGKLYLWVGGRIKINANQPAGKYVGTFTLSVAY